MSDLLCYVCKCSVKHHDLGYMDACRQCGKCSTFYDERTGRIHLINKATDRVLEAARAWARHPRRDSTGEPLIKELREAVKELEELENE